MSQLLHQPGVNQRTSPKCSAHTARPSSSAPEQEAGGADGGDQAHLPQLLAPAGDGGQMEQVTCAFTHEGRVHNKFQRSMHHQALRSHHARS